MTREPVPGDLVTLKNRRHYTGVDITIGQHFNVPQDSIGVVLGYGKRIYENSANIHVLTQGRVVACAAGVWTVIDDAG
jgi:hypothetical protein